MKKSVQLFFCLLGLCTSYWVNGQDSLKIEDLQPYAYRFAVEEGELVGKGAAILTEAMANAHITLLGDEGRTALEYQLTDALVKELDRYEYKTMVLEVGAASIKTINRLANLPKQKKEVLKTLNQKYSLKRKKALYTPIPEFKSVEAAAYLQSAKDQNWSILSLGTESWTGYKMLVDELYGNLSTANQQANQALYLEVSSFLDRQYEIIPGQTNDALLQFTTSLRSSTEFQAFLQKMSTHTINIPIIESLQFSIDYWWMYGRREFYKKNKQKAKRNKDYLATTLRSRGFDFRKDKLFVKMWRNYLAKGTTTNGFYGVGNMLQEMAEFHGNTCLSVVIAPRFYEEEDSVKDALESPNIKRNLFKEFLPLGKKEAWILVDLRSFNEQFYWSPTQVSTAMQSIITR